MTVVSIAVKRYTSLQPADANQTDSAASTDAASAATSAPAADAGTSAGMPLAA